MASGISFLAGLLTGAAQGVEQGKKIKLAKEENEIRRQQVEATKALGFAQIQATKENQMASLGLQEKLGLLNVGLDRERIGLGYAGLGNQKELAGMEAMTRIYLQQAEAAARSGDLDKEARLRQLANETMWGLNEITRDRDVGRAVGQAVGIAEGVSPIEEGARSRARAEELEDFRARSEIDFEYGKKKEAFKDSFEVEKERRALENELAGTLMGMHFKGIDADEGFVKQAAGQFLAQAFLAGKDPATSAADAKKLIRDLGGDNAERRQRASNIVNDYFDGVVNKDPSATFNAMKAFREEYKPDKGGIRWDDAAGKKTGLTKPTTYIEWAQQNPDKISHDRKPMTVSDADVQRLVFSKPGLKDATIRAAKEANPVRSATDVWGNFDSPDNVAKWLVEQLNKHPEITGDTATRAAKFLETITRERLAPRAPSSGSGGAASPTFRTGR